MSQYKKRNRSDDTYLAQNARMEEQELVLRIKKDELFNRYIFLPHSEVNTVVYDAVNQFVQKYGGDTMTLTIMTDPISEPIQHVFREAYQSHYEDEFRKVAVYLSRRIVRAIILVLISAAAFMCSSFMARNGHLPDYIVAIIGQVAIFCLWEIGYTHFARKEAAEERSRIVRARDAEIEFQFRD